MKRESTPSDVGMKLVNMKSRVVSLPPTALPLMRDVKVRDVVDENERGSGAELSSNGRNDCNQLQIALKSEGMMYDVTFQRLLEPVEHFGEDISEGLNAATAIHLYNTCGTT